MARGKNKIVQKKSPSLRDNIKTYRRELHGDIAEAFDTAFCTLAGTGPFKKALNSGTDLQKAFVAAKLAAQEARKLHPIVDVPNLPEEDE